LKAAIKSKAGAGIEFRASHPEPELKNDTDVILRVRAVGICGTDVHIFKGHDIGNLPHLPIPFVLGHEFAGEISKLGKGVKNYKLGDRVCAEIALSCGECYYCKNNEPLYCVSVREIGVDLDGAYTEYVAVPARNLHLIPDSMTFEEGALVEPLSSAMHPFERLSLGIGDTIAIVGAGPIGLLAVGVAKSLGFGKIIVAGRHRNRLELAQYMGADHVVDIDDEDPIKKVRNLTRGEMGADVVLEAAGNPIALGQSLEMCRKDGQVCFAGATVEPATINSLLIVGKALRVFGSFDYTWLTFERSIEMIASKKIDPKKIVTHRFPLEDVNKAFDVLLKREAAKVIMAP
jgi:2-desacetyl-2-hydroxyethyl bacteriochlorophyllide A dehydrogenase